MKTFQNRLKSLKKPSDVLELMIQAIQNPVISLNFDFYYKQESKTECVGCAATNALLYKLPKYKRKKVLRFMQTANNNKHTMISENNQAVEEIIGHEHIIEDFELAINQLRLGSISGYNYHAWKINMVNFPQNESGEYKLPRLNNDYSQEEIQKYIDFKNHLKEKGL